MYKIEKHTDKYADIDSFGQRDNFTLTRKQLKQQNATSRGLSHNSKVTQFFYFFKNKYALTRKVVLENVKIFLKYSTFSRLVSFLMKFLYRHKHRRKKTDAQVARKTKITHKLAKLITASDSTEADGFGHPSIA